MLLKSFGRIVPFTIVLAGLSALYVPAAPAWEKTMTFDGDLGGKCRPWTFNKTEIVPDGQSGQGCKLSIKRGSDQWGGKLVFPEGLGRGTKIYFELYLFIPENFRVVTRNGSMKFLRFYAKTAEGKNAGSLDIQITEDTYPGRAFRMIKELQAKWYAFGDKGSLKRNQWHRINVEFEVDHEPMAHGGRSYVRVWLDGAEITNETRIQTIVNPTDTLKDFLLFSYYNNRSPIDQHVRVDGLVLTDTRPSWWGELQGSVRK